MIGKTGLHELAYGITSDNPHFGAIRNPRNPDHSPGGSSVGSAVAVATEMALLATGTDTGGSIRVPASFCGIVGLKPTYGLVSRIRVQPLGLSLDHVGPMARTVEDLRWGLHAMADRQSLKPAPVSIRGLRIGLPENFYFDTVLPEIRSAVHSAARRAEQFGAQIVPVRVPDIEAVNAIGLTTLLCEAAAVHRRHVARRSDFGIDVLALLDRGSEILATEYIAAQRKRGRFQRQFRALFATIDCLFTPTTPITAPRIGENQITINGATYDTRILTTRFVRAFNVIGFPALSIPCGISSDGLPIGLQLVGRPYEDNLLLAIGEALEVGP
jgi:aspartyl-tRNA(Asn)/glutamyl-tRNA(Gln) amidotransferase subunit A